MDWNLRKITCKQLMKQLEPLGSITKPRLGWIRTLRIALGMSLSQLGLKCGFSKQRILRIEQDEVSGNTTLASLDKVAQQLGCKLVYGFLPQKDLLQMIEERSALKALEKLSRISHSMALEDQKVDELAHKAQLSLLKERLMKQNIKTLWD